MRRFLIAGAAAAGLLALAVPAAQAQGTGGEQPPAGVVSTTPPTNLPHLPATTSQTEQIKQIVQCGSTMYAVGTFSTIRRGSTTYTRDNVFSFSATSPYTVTSWAPDVVGTYGTTSNPSDTVNTIAFANGNCADAYIGGHFSSVNGTTVGNIAEISTSTGNVVTGFESKASGAVQTIVAAGDHLLAGGNFTGINGDTTDPYMASLSPVTGKSDGFLHLNIHGNYSYPGVSSNATHVYNQQLSHSGTLDLVEGDFTSVGGLQREQMFMLNVSGATAAVTGWTSPEFDGSSSSYPYECATVEPFYIQAAAWSPDDSTIYIGTTGYHPNGYPVGQTPRTGLCDAAAAFPATQTSVLSKWINYTGCDSLYSAAADSGAAYFAGHERFSMNPDDCDALGTNAYNAPGMEGLDPANGNLYVNSGNTAGYYSRDRGLGADDMLLTSAGLWIASDNFDAAQYCGGVSTAGICFLPYQ
ncbi:MAG: hypothetical protein ACLQDY_10040 [Streptosporangiaceae bacterium]